MKEEEVRNFKHGGDSVHEKFSVADLKMEGATWQGRQTASKSQEWPWLTVASKEMTLVLQLQKPEFCQQSG